MEPRKRVQRKFNKLVREMNKNVRQDNLWMGRFEARQKDVWYERFPDGFGGILHSVIRIYDKGNGYYKDYHIEVIGSSYSHWAAAKLWEAMNTFIVEDDHVWDENPSPRDKGFVKDYTKQRIPDKAMTLLPANWYLKRHQEGE